MSSDGLRLDDELWERLLDLTDGDVALCYQCGECTAACPWGLVKPGALSVRTLLRQAQIGIEHLQADVWLCTTCGQCEATCPRAVDITRVFRALRQLAWEQNQVATGLPSMLWSLYWNDNPWSQPPSQRSAWAAKLDLEPFDAGRHEVLLYAGCTSSYNRRAQKITRALVTILRTAGVSFGYLGEEEPCCGEAALSSGNTPYFEEIAAKANRILADKGVARLVTVSPHCYDVFRNHYSPFNPKWQVFHYTQYLADLIKEKRLVLGTPLNLKLTFQDPCYLGRLNDEYQAPRQLLNAIPGIELVEMERTQRDGLCCGGGGGRMWLETPIGERFSDLRVREAIKSGASHLVTACPFCLSCLEDSASMLEGDDGLNVLDAAELMALALNTKAGGA